MSTPVTLTTGSLIFNCLQDCNSPRLYLQGHVEAVFPLGREEGQEVPGGQVLDHLGPQPRGGGQVWRVRGHLRRQEQHWEWVRGIDIWPDTGITQPDTGHGTQSCYWSFQAISAASRGHIWETINLHIPQPERRFETDFTRLLCHLVTLSCCLWGCVWRKFMVLQILNATWDQPQAVIYLGSCQLPVLMFLWINYLTQRSVWLHANPNDMRPTMEDWGAHGNFFMANIIY